MSGLGRKQWSPGDVLTASDVNGYLMDQSVMVFAGTAARASAIPTPSAGMVAYSTATQLQVYDGSDWVDLSTGYGVATGGASTAITVDGVNYTLLTFDTSSTLSIIKPGLFEVFVVGAGGAGARRTSLTIGAGGGGGGQYTQNTIYLDANATVTVGAGAPVQTVANVGGSGTHSSVNEVVAGGGGGGSNSGTFTSAAGSSGGNPLTVSGVALTPINANDGGLGSSTGYGGGGGGGSAAAGSNGSGNNGGAGGAGFDVSAYIAGSSYFISAGGGGGATSTGGAAGSVGAGAGGSSSAAGDNATNYGCGGGGGVAGGGSGFDGVVYVRFKV
jgi:hypothetical protein